MKYLWPVLISLNLLFPAYARANCDNLNRVTATHCKQIQRAFSILGCDLQSTSFTVCSTLKNALKAKKPSFCGKDSFCLGIILGASVEECQELGKQPLVRICTPKTIDMIMKSCEGLKLGLDLNTACPSSPQNFQLDPALAVCTAVRAVAIRANQVTHLGEEQVLPLKELAAKKIPAIHEIPQHILDSLEVFTSVANNQFIQKAIESNRKEKDSTSDSSTNSPAVTRTQSGSAH